MHPRWTRYDTAYLALGAAFALLAALFRGSESLIAAPFVVLAYCAGRSIARH